MSVESPKSARQRVNIVQELDGDEDSNAGNSATTSSASHNVDYS